MAKITRFNPDLSPIARAIALWLEDKTSKMTRREYEKDLRYFFEVMSGKEVTEELVSAFLKISQSQANAALMAYKAALKKRVLAPTTINRKISAVKSFISTANRLGLCQFSLKDAVKSEKLKPYRDTSGIPLAEFKKVLRLCDLSTLKGKRDKALLMLFWSNALRRNEVSLLDIGDFVPSSRILWVKGKGRSEKESVDLSPKTIQAICDWLADRGSAGIKSSFPLFISLDSRSRGSRLSGDGLYKIVRCYCREAGIDKLMSPHRIRHSSITMALDKSDGDVRKVQKLSRHKNLNTLMIYDDNRNNDQLELSELLEEDL